MSDPNHELRRFPRLESRQAVLVRRVDDASPIEELAPTKTIAIGGCCLVIDEPLGKGSQVELLISLDKHVVTARGEVVYEIPAGDGRTETGIQFARLDDEAAHAIHRLFIKKPD